MSAEADEILRQLLTLLANGKLNVDEIQEVCKSLYGAETLSKSERESIAQSINKYLGILPAACSNCGPPGWQSMREA